MIAWIFSGSKELQKDIYFAMPEAMRRDFALTPVGEDRGEWVRLNYCGLELHGIICGEGANTSQGAFDYLLSRIREDNPVFMLDKHHLGLAETWYENAKGHCYDDTHLRHITDLAKKMGVEVDELLT